MRNMKMSKLLFVTLLVVASAVLVTSFTECDDVLDGVCYQHCDGGNCNMKCLRKDNYRSCQQTCKGGNCNMKCTAPSKCDFNCSGGNCQSAICKARDTCEQSCTGGGCSLNCYGTSCKQSCTEGNCELQCAKDALKCEQSCTMCNTLVYKITLYSPPGGEETRLLKTCLCS